MENIDKKILFLSGIIILCFGFLLFHIDPYKIIATDFWSWLQIFIDTLVWKPVATIGVIVGIFFIYRATRK
ncbi:hypothetical protein [Streptococcus suis]|uniref:hypothetical protein n=1 Tax=Streptococcus suis TaxID=1307 RepID=UPI002A7DB78D|nr:hypothetical protein [Streptococcus suis]HEM3580733.1 hypothetical protein [Streptococcus suis]